MTEKENEKMHKGIKDFKKDPEAAPFVPFIL